MVVSASNVRSYTHKVSPVQLPKLSKHKANRHAKEGDREHPQGLINQTQRATSKEGTVRVGKSSPHQGRAHQLITQHQMLS